MQTFQSFDTTSIISSTKSTNSKRQNAPGDAQSTISLGIKNPSTLSYSNYPLNNHANHFAHPGPLKNTLSIRLAESAVFLRTNDLTGRNRYGDSRPTYLRGVVQLELVKPTRISRIVLELGAKVGTIWPEAHVTRDLVESHKVFSATETVFSALPANTISNRDRSVSRQRYHISNDTSFVTFEDDSPPASPTSSPTITSGWVSGNGWISPDVRSLQSSTSGTITPTTTRRALSADSTWTRRSGGSAVSGVVSPSPVTMKPTSIPENTISRLPLAPPAYSEIPLHITTDSTESALHRTATNEALKSPESPESPEETPVYTESRISFQTGVNQSRMHAPNGIHHHGNRIRAKSASKAALRGEPNAPLPETPTMSSSVMGSSSHPYASPTALPNVPGPSESSSSISRGGNENVENADNGNIVDVAATGYEYAQAHARAHSDRLRSQQSLGHLPSQVQSHQSPTIHDNEDEAEPTRGRKKTRSRFSFANLGLGKIVHALSRSRSRSKSTMHAESHSERSERSESPSRVSTRSGVSARSGVSGITTISTDTKNTKNSKRSISLPWRRRRRGSTSTTASGVSGVSTGTTGTTNTTNTTGTNNNQTDELGFLDISNRAHNSAHSPLPPPLPSPLPPSITPSNRSYSTSSEASTSASHSTRSVSQSSRSVSHTSSASTSPSHSPRLPSSPSPPLSANRRSPSSDAQSHISFADLADYDPPSIPPTPPSPSILSSITRPSSVLSRYSTSSKDKDRDRSQDRSRDRDASGSNISAVSGPSGPGWKEFPKGIYTYPILFSIPGHAPPSLDTATAHRKAYGQDSWNTVNAGVLGNDGLAGGTGGTGIAGSFASENAEGHNVDALPRCTLKWQLKASVHRPGAFASKMQVTHEISVVCGPSDDDGAAGGDDGANAPGGGGGGENVIVERIWDAAAATGGTSSNDRQGMGPPTFMPPPVPPLPTLPLSTPPPSFQRSGGSGRPSRPLPPPPPTASPIPPSPTSPSFLNISETSPFIAASSTPSVLSNTPLLPSSLYTSMAPSLSHSISPPLSPSPFSILTENNPGGNGSGSLHYLITISGRSFPIGGMIPIEITLMPLEKVRVHRVSVNIEQKIEYHTQFKRVERTDPVLTVPLLSLKHDLPSSSSSKEKELKHILPLESDDPEALMKSPLYGVMRKSLMRSMRRGGDVDFEDVEDIHDLDHGDGYEPSDLSEPEEEISSVEESDDNEDEDDLDGSDDSEISDSLDDIDGFLTSDAESKPFSEYNDANVHSQYFSQRLPRRSRNSSERSRRGHHHPRKDIRKPSLSALSSLASSLMGPGPWNMSLALPLPLAHASNLTPKQVQEYEEKMEVYRQQQQEGQQHGFVGGAFSGYSGYTKRDSFGTRKTEKEWEKKQAQNGKANKREKKPELVDIGRGLLPSNKNKRSNVTISHLLKCVIRVERGELEEDEEVGEGEKEEGSTNSPETSTFPPLQTKYETGDSRAFGGASAGMSASALADADRSGWADEWEYVQSTKEIRQQRESRERKVRVQEPTKPRPKQKPKKKRKLFDIVVQTPIQVLSCRCNPEFASLPGYTPHAPSDPNGIDMSPAIPSTASTSSSFNTSSIPSTSMPSSTPSTPGAESSTRVMISTAPIASDACPCILKARLKQARRERRLRRRELKRELREQRREMMKFMERRRSRMHDTEGADGARDREDGQRGGSHLREERERFPNYRDNGADGGDRDENEVEESLERTQRKERERRDRAKIRRREALVTLSSPPAAPLPPPPPLPSPSPHPPTELPLAPLPPPPPTAMDSFAPSNMQGTHQRTSFSSARTNSTANTATTTHSSSTSHTNASITSAPSAYLAQGPSILRSGKTKRSSGFSGLGFGGIITARPTQGTVERRLTGGSQISHLSYQSQLSQLSKLTQSTSASASSSTPGLEMGGGAVGGGLIYSSQEFEDLVAGHMDEAGEAPPTYEHVALVLAERRENTS